MAINAATVDGKGYEIPESMKPVELFSNNTILTTAPATTDDWKASASKLGWVYGANGGGAYYLWGLFSSFGGKILDDSGKCAAATGVPDALKWLQDMKAAGMKVYQNDNDAKADLISGKIAGQEIRALRTELPDALPLVVSGRAVNLLAKPIAEVRTAADEVSRRGGTP